MKLDPKDAEAVKMVVRMDALFLVDRQARHEGMTGAERLAFRREHAQSRVDEIRQARQTISKQALPQNALGRAGLDRRTLNQVADITPARWLAGRG